MIREIDLEGNGIITKQEFMDVMHETGELPGKSDKEEVKKEGKDVAVDSAAESKEKDE